MARDKLVDAVTAIVPWLKEMSDWPGDSSHGLVSKFMTADQAREILEALDERVHSGEERGGQERKG